MAATYHSPRPKDGIEDGQPSLLAKASQGLSLSDALKFSEGRKQVFHGGGTKASEDDNAESNEKGIVESNSVLVQFGRGVAQAEELGRVYAGFGNEVVGEEEQGEEVEGEA